MRSSQDEATLESALQVNTSVPQVAVQPPIVINVTTNVTTIPINPAREEFLTGMVRTYQTLDEDATTSTLIDQFFSYLMDSCIGGAPGPERGGSQLDLQRRGECLRRSHLGHPRARAPVQLPC